MANPIMRSSDFKAVVEPLLNEIYDGIYDQRKDEWKAFASEEKPKNERSYHEEVMQYGFSAAPELPDGQPVTYDAGGVHYITRTPYLIYGLAFALTQVLQEDGEAINFGSQFSKHLAQSLIETKETKMANILNRAFNGAYASSGDGQSLVSLSHPNAANGGVWSNRLTADANLSQTSLEQMLIQIREATDPRGKKIRMTPDKLIIAPSNIMNAEVVLNSALKTGSNNNDLNPIKSKGLVPGGAHDISRMTNPKAWFITTDKNADKGIKLYMRRKVSKGMEGDFETGNLKYKSTERYGTNWHDARGIFGTPGL